MKAYRIEETFIYVGTLAEAHKEAKRLVREGDFRDWRDVKIAELEVATDKAGILALLNDKAVLDYTGKCWEFRSAKLGLMESTGLE